MWRQCACSAAVWLMYCANLMLLTPTLLTEACSGAIQHHFVPRCALTSGFECDTLSLKLHRKDDRLHGSPGSSRYHHASSSQLCGVVRLMRVLSFACLQLAFDSVNQITTVPMLRVLRCAASRYHGIKCFSACIGIGESPNVFI